MRNLAIIYGPPRSATTFLHDALIQHKQCFGGKETNENPWINTNDTKEIDRLWNEYVPTLARFVSRYLVLKAPGYGFEYHYFNSLKGYDCKYLFVNRDPIEVIDSMLSHKVCLEVAEMDIESTDCPRRMLDDLGYLWDESDLINRMALHYFWHIEGMDPELENVQLSLTPYKARNDGVKMAANIAYHLGIDSDPAMTKALTKFYHRSVTAKRRSEIESRITQEVVERLERL